MNEFVQKTQERYRKKREEFCYSIFDIGELLKDLAKEGRVWILKDIEGLSEAEGILIEHYLNEFREQQIYDNLVNSSGTSLSLNKKIEFPHSSSSKKKPKKKPIPLLKIQDVRQYSGYQKAVELEKMICEAVENFPSYEKRNVIDQISRSSSSIKKSIAEGEQLYVRETFKMYAIAIGSAKETLAWLQISFKLGYIKKIQFEKMSKLTNQTVGILTRTLINLKNKYRSYTDLPNPVTPDVSKFIAFQKSLMLVEQTYEMTREKAFWQEKDLQRKMRKSATSVGANIAEAHQFYVRKKFSFFNKSIESLSALHSLLETSLNKGLIIEEKYDQEVKLIKVIRNILLKTLGNLSKQKAS